MPKVSIIVPVYNAGARLRPCLDSLVNQSLKEIEIILVLDCPTDGSDIVAEEYAAVDSRIKLIHNSQNLNIGLSRNEGLKIASGEYVGFSDHDDYSFPELFESLYCAAMSKNSDIAISDYYGEVNGVRCRYSFPNETDSTTFINGLNTAVWTACQSKPNSVSYNNVNPIWIQIFKRTFLENNRLTFTDNRLIPMEDVAFLSRVYFFNPSIVHISEPLYWHITTGANTENGYNYSSYDGTVRHLLFLNEFLQNQKADDSYFRMLSVSALKRLYKSFRTELRFKGLKAGMRIPYAISKNREIVHLLKDVDLNGFSLTKRIFYKFIFMFKHNG